MRSVFSAGVVLLLHAAAATCAEGPLVPPLLIRNVNLVPMTAERVVDEVSVLVRDGKVAAIEPSAALEPPQGATVVDGTGRYLLPGLTEMHIHLRNRLSLDLLLGNGVTKARNMDGTPEVLEWRRAIAADRTLGPSLLSASPFLHRHAEDSPTRYVGSIDDARRLTRQYAEQGYDYIKIAELDDAPFFALIEEARRLGIPVVGHIPNYELGLDVVLAQGMASIEHIEELFRVYFDYEPDESRIGPFVAMVRRSGVPISTLIHTEEVKNALFIEGERYLTAERLVWIEKYSGAQGVERIRATLEAIRNGNWQRQRVDIDFLLRLTKALHDAGVVIVPGTDSGGALVVAGFGLHEELALLQRAGLSPYEAIRAATVNAAEVLGLADRTGTVEVGKDADLILVRGNPLADLMALREPLGLVLRGRWLDEDAVARLRNRRFGDVGTRSDP